MAYSIDELICEIDEDRDGIAQLEAIIDQCQRKIYRIQEVLRYDDQCEGPDDCDAHHPCQRHAAEANAGRFQQR